MIIKINEAAYVLIRFKRKLKNTKKTNPKEITILGISIVVRSFFIESGEEGADASQASSTVP
jgi:hypothetical protein